MSLTKDIRSLIARPAAGNFGMPAAACPKQLLVVGGNGTRTQPLGGDII